MSDAPYLAWVRTQPCAAQPCAATPCEANHSTVAPTYAPGERQPKQLPGRRGKGQKSADYYAFPLCSRHHGQFHRIVGYFEGWTGAELERWQNAQSALYRELYEATGEDPVHVAQKAAAKAKPTLRQEAEGFGQHYPMIGAQGVHDLERLLRKVAKGAVF